jgi:hypothetical protein
MGMPFAKLAGMNKHGIMSGLVCLLIFIASAVAFGNTETPEANRKRAEMLWEEAVRAKGGRERLHSINSFVVSSTSDHHVVSLPFNDYPLRPHVETQNERLYVMPGKAWIYELTPDYDTSLEAKVMNLDRNFCMLRLAPVGPMGSVPGLSFCVPTIWTESLIQDPVVYLMETKWVRPVPFRTRTEGKGKKQQDVVEIEVGKLRVDFYLDRKTHLPVKLVTEKYHGVFSSKPRMDLSIKLQDYADVDGIQMPRRLIREPLLTNAVIRSKEYAKYKFNVTFDESIFNRPVPKKAKFDDWKGTRKGSKTAAGVV